MLLRYHPNSPALTGKTHSGHTSICHSMSRSNPVSPTQRSAFRFALPSPLAATSTAVISPSTALSSDLCQLLLSVIGFDVFYSFLYLGILTQLFGKVKSKNCAFALVLYTPSRYIDVSETKKCLNCPIFVQIGQICLCRADQFALEPPTESQKNRKTTQNSSE